MSELGEPRTTDYCLSCGQSPESGDHMFGKCVYQDPRVPPGVAGGWQPPVSQLEGTWLPHIWADPDFRAAIEACDRILKGKGDDYTQKKPDRLCNFKEAATFMGTTQYQALGTYLYKHFTAVFSFLKHGQVESEPIEGRIFDVINYCLLLYKMIQEDKQVSPGPYTRKKNDI